MIADIRTHSQQLTHPAFDTPKELVRWMGAIQAQDYPMSKWAVGVRLKLGSMQAVEKALEQGEILRTHIMRPTWHLVAAEDIRWMLSLTSHRLQAVYHSYAKGRGVTLSPKQYNSHKNLLIRMLEGNRSLTYQEIEAEFIRAGVVEAGKEEERYQVKYLIALAEVEGVICSGVDKGKKATHALLDERVLPTRELHKEEALALLAERYFKSHSPASLNDFTWWSGLTITEARQAMNLIASELISDRFAAEKLFVHQSYQHIPVLQEETLHLLPAFDEYLISYKDRTAVIDLEHHPKAFNNWGTFYPVILHNGKIVGNWKKLIKKGAITIETSFFDPDIGIDQEQLQSAEGRYKNFIK